MLRTLSFLILATCGAALLLGWLDPARSCGSTRDVARIQRSAEQAVADQIDPRRRTWREVEVRLVSESGGRGGLLAAQSGSAPWHFWVGPDGIPTRGRRWASPDPNDTSQVILIHATPVMEGGELSPIQVVGLRSLIRSLNSLLAHPAQSLPVQVYLSS